MIKFKTLYLEGFSSIAESYTLKFKSKGLVLIKGPNGAGKTTGFSGLYWILYGKPLKPGATVTTYAKYQPKGYLGTLGYVELIVNDKYFKIIRCLEYKGEIVPQVKGVNRLMVLDKEGNELFSNKSKPELQQLITEKIIGLSPELFKSSIVFGQKLKRLVDEDGPTKKKIFEEAFGVDYINMAKDLAYKKFKALEAELIPIDRAYFGKTSAIESRQSALEAIREKMATHEEDKAKQIKGIRDAIKEHRASLKNLLNDKDLYLEAKAKVAELRAKLVELEKAFDSDKYYEVMGKVARANAQESLYQGSIDKEEAKLKKLEKTGKCPACGQDITAADKADHIEEIKAEISRYKLAMNEVKLALKGHKITLASLVKTQKHIESYKDKIDRLEERLSEAYIYDPLLETKVLDKIEAQKAQIKEIEESVINFGEEEAIGELDRLQTEATKLWGELKGIKKKYQVQEWLYTKALSNSGLKAFIFNQMLDQLNIILERYSRQFGIRPYFAIDMQSARKDIISYAYINGTPVAFADLSGGQSQLANIITAFAAHDLIAQDRFNIMVLDELFESLDASNIEVVSELIAMKTQNQQVFLVTHLKGFNPTGAQTLEFILQDGVTRPLL